MPEAPRYCKNRCTQAELPAFSSATFVPCTAAWPRAKVFVSAVSVSSDFAVLMRERAITSPHVINRSLARAVKRCVRVSGGFSMVKVLLWIAAIIFIIGMLVVFGILDFIF
jgi:hypothetical protein